MEWDGTLRRACGPPPSSPLPPPPPPPLRRPPPARPRGPASPAAPGGARGPPRGAPPGPAGPGVPGFECARLDVPLDRSGGESGTVPLAVARVPVSSNPRSVAVVALAGGPGQAALDLATD